MCPFRSGVRQGGPSHYFSTTFTVGPGQGNRAINRKQVVCRLERKVHLFAYDMIVYVKTNPEELTRHAE